MNELTVPKEIERRDFQRLITYRDNLDFYNGIQWLGNPRRGERRITFNYAKAFVEKVASYLMSGLSFAVDPSDDSEEAQQRARRAEEALREVYEASNLAQLDFDTELDTAILGDGCFKVTWDNEEQRIRVSAPDVTGLFVWWVGDDVTRVWRVASRYQLSADEVEFLHGVKNGKRESVVVEAWTADGFELWVDNILLEQKPNPYGFIPFIIYPNLREPKKFWGVSDIAAIKEPMRELNRALSQLSTILELSGNPIAVLENVELRCATQLQAVRPATSKGFLAFGDLLAGKADADVDLMLQSPGGDIDVAEKIVYMLKSRAKSFRVIVPESAKSAATLLALAADEIVMGYTSELGPIDPQIIDSTPDGRIISRPARSFLDGLRAIRDEVDKAGGRLSPVYFPLLQQLDPALIDFCKKAISRSERFAEKWLKKSQCKDNPKKARQIAKALVNVERYILHGTVIDFDEAQKLGLCVKFLPAEEKLWEAIWRLYCAYEVDMRNEKLAKIFESTKVSIPLK